MAVMIGIDPHKASHTVAAIDNSEAPLGDLRIRSGPTQLEQLLAWAAKWTERTWAVEGAAGLGYLLAQQLVAAGERVLDVQPKLAARVRLLATSSTNKNDPNDARSVAVTALRSPEPQEVRREDHAAVMKIWAKRRRELVSARTQTVCRLHAVLCELVPGGISGQLYATKAANMLDEFEPDTAVNAARHDLGLELLADLRRIDEQLRETKQRIAQAVAASKTTLTELYGVGPIVAAMVIGYVGDVTRFASSDRFAAYNGTAPIEVSSGPRTIHRLSRRGNRRLNHAIHMAAVTQIRNLDSQGRAYYDRKIAEGKSGKEALRALKRRISDAIFRQLLIDAERARATAMGPGGQAGNGSKASVTDSHPEGRLFGEATSEPETTLRPAARAVRSKGAKTPARSARKAS